MRQAHIVSVDYEELAAYLHHTYDESVLRDDPLPASARFQYFRGILADHAEEMMDELQGDNDSTLTHILLRSHVWGCVKDVQVSLAPGHVARVEGEVIVLPYILIHVID